MRNLLVVLIVVLSSRVAVSLEPRAYVEQMFTADRTKSGQAAAGTALAALRKAVPGDPRVDYACALALVRQQRLPQAREYLDRYLAAVPADVEALQMNVYLHLQAREIEDALAACHSIASQLPKTPSDRPEWAAAAQFVGTVVGYLEQAYVETSGKGDARQKQKNDLLAVMPALWLEQFDAGRLQVANRLAELQTAQTAKTDQALAVQDQKKEFVEATIDQRKAEISINDERVQTNAATVRDAQRQLTVIQGQLNSLLADRSVLAAQHAVAMARFLEMQERLTELSGNNRSLRQNVSPGDIAIFNNLGIALAALSNQMFKLDRQIQTLRGEATALIAKARQSGAAVAESQQAIAEAETRTQALEKQARRLEQAQQKAQAKPPIQRMTAQMRALATYLPSPLEREQARVVTWFD